MAFGDRGIRNAAAGRGRRSLPATHVTPQPGLPARPASPLTRHSSPEGKSCNLERGTGREQCALGQPASSKAAK